MSMTPSRQRRPFSASARKANTASRGRAMTVVPVASGIDAALGEQLLELVEPAVPAHAVGRGGVALGELCVDQDDLGLLAAVAELDVHQRPRPVRGRPRLPP